MRRNAINRGIENFLIKFPEYKDRIHFLSGSFEVTFSGFLYSEANLFKPFTPRAKVFGWLGRCRASDKKLLEKREVFKAGQMQENLF